VRLQDSSLQGYALLNAILTTLLFASRLAVIKAFPYAFDVHTPA
jgi:hypothetical protein